MLSLEDIDLLLETLDVWESNPISTTFTASLLGIILLPKDDEQKKSGFLEEQRDADTKTKARKEKTAVLRAKLILMKNKTVVDEEFSEFLKSS